MSEGYDDSNNPHYGVDGSDFDQAGGEEDYESGYEGYEDGGLTAEDFAGLPEDQQQAIAEAMGYEVVGPLEDESLPHHEWAPVAWEAAGQIPVEERADILAAFAEAGGLNPADEVERQLYLAASVEAAEGGDGQAWHRLLGALDPVGPVSKRSARTYVSPRDLAARRCTYPLGCVEPALEPGVVVFCRVHHERALARAAELRAAARLVRDGSQRSAAAA